MTNTEVLRTLARAQTLSLDGALDALNDLREARDDAETAVDTDIDGPLNDLETAIVALEGLRDKHWVGIAGVDVLLLRSSLEDFQNTFGDTDTLQSVVEAYDEALEAVEVCIDLEESTPGEYPVERKIEARRAVSETLSALADALDKAAVTP